MKTWLIILMVLIVVVGGVILFWSMKSREVVQNGGNNIPEPEAPLTTDRIRVEKPLPNQLIISPLTIQGEARGLWFFEASFPIRLIDDAGNELGVAVAQAQGEWMTEEFVPFLATLTFTNPSTDTGVLVFEKDNPSGLPEHSDEVRMPVRFR